MIRVFVVAVLGLASLLVLGELRAQPEAPQKTQHALPDLRPNDDWQELSPAPPKGMQARGWSDPAAGCHLLMLRLPIPDTASAEKIIASLSATLLAKSDLKLLPADIGSSGAPDAATGKASRRRLEGAGVEGVASLVVASAQARQDTLLSCYWNQREPSHCSALCDKALQEVIKP